MSTRLATRHKHRLLERLFRLLGVQSRPPSASIPLVEALEQRTLMSITGIGSPILVDSGASPLNINPQIATAANGNFVVVWATSNTGNIAWRLFDSTGTPLTDESITGNSISNATAGGGAPSSPSLTQALHQQQFDVAMDAAGDFVIAWQGATDIYAQQYDPAGTAVGSPINVTNTAADVAETSPAVAMDAEGDFAVTWLADTSVGVNIHTMTPKSYDDEIDQSSHKVVRNTTPLATDTASSSYITSVVQARRFDATGSGGALIQVSPIVADAAVGTVSSSFTTDLNPDIAMDAAGDFAVAWDAVGYAPQKTLDTPIDKTSQVQYFYDSNNAQVKATLHYYTGAAFYYNMAPAGVKAMAQRYTAAGTAQAATAPPPLSKVPSTAAGQIAGVDVKISMDAAGDFAVTGAFQYEKSKVVTDGQSGDTSNYYATSSIIAAKRYNAAGAVVGSEASIATAALTPFFSSSPLGIESAELTNLATAMDSSGNLLVVWDKFAYDSGSTSMVSSGLFGRRYNAAGVPQETTAFQVPFAAASGPGAPTGPFAPAVAFSGGVIDLAFQSAEDADTTDIFAAAYHPVLPASKVVFTGQPSDGTAGKLDEIDVTLEDANGFVVTDGSSAVKLAVFSGPTGSVLSGTTSVMTVNGVAAFTNVSLTRGGTYVLKATDGSLASATSSSFQIVTVPTQLAFTTQPANGTAGTALPAIAVSVRDLNGDLSVADSSTVTLSVATGPSGTISGTLSVAAINGVATFTGLSLPTAGTYTLLAADSGLANATSSKFTLTAGAATNFTFSTEPVSTTAGTKFTVKVSATDAHANPALLDHSKVILEIFGTNPAGTLTGGSTTMTLSAGAATFTGLDVPTAGTFTLAAFSNATGVASSSSFTITPAAAAKLIYDVSPSLTVAGAAISGHPEVDVLDAFGNIVANGSAVTLSVASGPAGFAAPGGTLVQNASTGIVLFGNVTLAKAGAYTLKATMGKLSVTSAKFTVNPADASQLVILAQPKPAVAGVAIKPSVTAAVEDAFGNVETGNTAVVAMSIHSGAGSLFGNATASAVKGIATFSNLILQTAGTHTLAASQGSLTLGVSNAFLISPAAGASLQFVQDPSDVVAGQTMSAATTVKLLDAFGNLATGDHSTVTLKVASGPPGSKLFGKFSAAAANGVATFGSLTLQTAGSYTLAATDGKMVGDTSSLFTVTAAVAAKMVFATVPTTVTAGSGFAVQVKLLDAFGNLATGDSSHVVLSLGTKPAGGALGGSLTVTASSGVANFAALTLALTGKYSLKATDENPLAVITSGMINVTAPVA